MTAILFIGLLMMLIQGIVQNQRSIEWYPKESSRYRIRAVDDKGRADTRNIRVDIIGVINKQEIEAN